MVEETVNTSNKPKTKTNNNRPKSVYAWTIVDVQKWFRRHCADYLQYAERFADHEITGRTLLRITDNTLLRMGIKNSVHRDAIWREILKLKLKTDIVEIRDLERRNTILSLTNSEAYRMGKLLAAVATELLDGFLYLYVMFYQMDSHMRTVQKKRTANFREDETKLLIQLWGSPLIQNKLFLTHRKAPVMRILAANMQQRGFYRTPDEIKTRIRNLKCLYHRIKRTMACGTGLGTVDPDWPHFKAMDAILSKPGLRKDKVDDNLLEGPKCEDIKQEIDIDINDDMESWATNDSMGSDYEEQPSPPPLQPAPTISSKINGEQSKGGRVEGQNKTAHAVVPSFTIPAHALQAPQGNSNGVRPGPVPSIPLPLLILNSLQPQQAAEKKDGASTSNFNDKFPTDLHNILKELLEVQKENLEIEKQKLEIEKQRLEFDRLVGTQLVTLVPMIGGLLQRLSFPTSQDLINLAASTAKNGKKRQASSAELDILKDSKILRTMLEQGIKKYMMSEENDENDKDSVNDDSGIQNDENSSSSHK